MHQQQYCHMIHAPADDIPDTVSVRKYYVSENSLSVLLKLLGSSAERTRDSIGPVHSILICGMKY